MGKEKSGYEYKLVCNYFTNIIIDFDNKSKKRIIKAWKTPSLRDVYSHNFYEIIVFIFHKKIIILGHREGIPFERRLEYKDMNHLEFIINITYIQNCFYAFNDKQPVLKIKEVKNEK